MDWTLCIVCQQKTREVLECPLNAGPAGDESNAYRTFLSNAKEFKELNQLPVPLHFGQDIYVDQLVENQAKWHKSCHLKFNLACFKGQGRERQMKTQRYIVLQIRDPDYSASLWTRVIVYSVESRMDSSISSGLLMQIRM